MYFSLGSLKSQRESITEKTITKSCLNITFKNLTMHKPASVSKFLKSLSIDNLPKAGKMTKKKLATLIKYHPFVSILQKFCQTLTKRLKEPLLAAASGH